MGLLSLSSSAYPADFSSQGVASRMPRFVHRNWTNIVKWTSIMFLPENELRSLCWLGEPSHHRRRYWETSRKIAAGKPISEFYRIRIRIHRIHMVLGLLDPDPDPLVTRYESGSGYRRSKNSKLCLLFDFLFLLASWRSMTKKAGSASACVGSYSFVLCKLNVKLGRVMPVWTFVHYVINPV